MTSDVKLSDQLEAWYREHPDEWIQGSFVRMTENKLCYCIVGKSASLLGVQVQIYQENNINLEDVVYMRTDDMQQALYNYARMHGLPSFPILAAINDYWGFEEALVELRSHGL